MKLVSCVPGFDELLDGGIETQTLLEFHGNSDSGRSAFAHQFAVTSQLPVEHGGLNSGCIYIDTRDAFQPEHIQTVIETLPEEKTDKLYERYEVSQRSANTETLTEHVIDNIDVMTPTSTEEQILQGERAHELAKTNNIRTVIVDSLTNLFTEEYSGRSELAERQQKLNKHIHDITRVVDRNDGCAIVTNSVTNASTPVGGELINSHFTHRIPLKKTSGTVRRAQLIGGEDVENYEFDFRLKNGCIVSN